MYVNYDNLHFFTNTENEQTVLKYIYLLLLFAAGMAYDLEIQKFVVLFFVLLHCCYYSTINSTGTA